VTDCDDSSDEIQCGLGIEDVTSVGKFRTERSEEIITQPFTGETKEVHAEIGGCMHMWITRKNSQVMNSGDASIVCLFPVDCIFLV